MIGSSGKMTRIKEDMTANESRSLEVETIASYLNALKLIFVIEELEAWNPNLRSVTAIRTSTTMHFVDPSIAVAS